MCSQSPERRGKATTGMLVTTGTEEAQMDKRPILQDKGLLVALQQQSQMPRPTTRLTENSFDTTSNLPSNRSTAATLFTCSYFALNALAAAGIISQGLICFALSECMHSIISSQVLLPWPLYISVIW